MRFLQAFKAFIAATVGQVWLKLRPRPSAAISTSEAERLDRLRHPSKYLGK